MLFPLPLDALPRERAAHVGEEDFVKSWPQKIVFSKESNTSSPRPSLMEYIALKREDTESSSQSRTNLRKFMSQCDTDSKLGLTWHYSSTP
jgi:hypothetical protein